MLAARTQHQGVLTRNPENVPGCNATADGGHAPGPVDGNSRSGNEDTDKDVHPPPRGPGQDRRGLGAGGIARLFSATWSCPGHGRPGRQFLAPARQWLIRDVSAQNASVISMAAGWPAFVCPTTQKD